MRQAYDYWQDQPGSLPSRATRNQPGAHDPQRHRPSDDRRSDRLPPPPEEGRSDRPPHRTRWLQHVRAQCLLRVGVARAPIFWEDPRARRRNRTRCTEARRTRPGAQRVHSVPRSTRWPRAAHSTKETRHDAGPNAHCAGPVKKPPGSLSRTRQPLPSARQVRNDPKQSDAPAAAARWPWCAGPPIASLEEGRDGRPLHALACTRRLRRVAKPFTQFQDAQARTQGPARPGRVPVRILKGPC